MTFTDLDAPGALVELGLEVFAIAARCLDFVGKHQSCCLPVASLDDIVSQVTELRASLGEWTI